MMEHFQFAQPEWLYVLPFILCLLILRRRRGAEGSITYPTVRFIAPLARTPHSLAGKIGAVCFVLAAAAIAIALVVLVWYFVFREDGSKGEVMTDFVTRGSIQSMVAAPSCTSPIL